jgi:hypothetical protein
VQTNSYSSRASAVRQKLVGFTSENFGCPLRYSTGKERRLSLYEPVPARGDSESGCHPQLRAAKFLAGDPKLAAVFSLILLEHADDETTSTANSARTQIPLGEPYLCPG